MKRFITRNDYFLSNFKYQSKLTTIISIQTEMNQLVL